MRETVIPVNDGGDVLLLKVLDFRIIPLHVVQVPTGCVLDGRKSAEWECSQHCKPQTDVEIVAIVT